MPPKLGILAGRGELPARIIQACRETGSIFIIVPLRVICGRREQPALMSALGHKQT